MQSQGPNNSQLYIYSLSELDFEVRHGSFWGHTWKPGISSLVTAFFSSTCRRWWREDNNSERERRHDQRHRLIKGFVNNLTHLDRVGRNDSIEGFANWRLNFCSVFWNHLSFHLQCLLFLFLLLLLLFARCYFCCCNSCCFNFVTVAVVVWSIKLAGQRW